MMERPGWEDMSTSSLDAPNNWDWQIDDELAHHVWQLTSESQYMGFGPEPPVLLEALMGFFPNEGMSSTLNSWYFTRDTDQEYTDHTTWWDIGNQFGTPDGDPDTTDILYSPDTSPHPLRSKLWSQQYTTAGAMFTYEFTQWQGEQPSGMMRIPVPTEVLDDLRDEIEHTPFEEFAYQSRMYNSQFGNVPSDESTFHHPHFRAESKTTQQDYMELFDIAFKYMDEGTKIVQD